MAIYKKNPVKAGFCVYTSGREGTRTPDLTDVNRAL